MSYIINDFVDLTKTEKIVLDNGEIQEKKVATTKDQFYSNQSKKTNYQQSSMNDARTSSSPNKNRYFGLLSTSDKEINNRLYDYDSWKKTVTDGTWVGNPYAKPILRHHDLYSGDSVGRMKDSFFYDNSTGASVSTSGKKLPNEVIDYFKNNKCFDSGTGTVIVEFTPDDYTADRIERGLDVTLSQSSVMDKLVCGICDKNYYGGECNHLAGRTYEVESDGVTRHTKCLVRAYDYSPIELSLVNHPANDVSIICVMKPKNSSSSDSELNSEPQIDENEELSKNNKEHATDNKKVEVPNLFKKIAKDHFVSQISGKFNDTEEMKTSFDTLFETLTEDQVEVFSDFLNKLEPKVQEDNEEVETPEVPEASVTEEPETPEVPEVTEVPEASVTEEPEVPETSTDNVSENKEKNLKDVFSPVGELKSTTVQDKEILAYLKNYEF